MRTKKLQQPLNYKNEFYDKCLIELEKADKIVIGAGSGLSASAGLDYNDESVFSKAYAPFLKVGYKTIYDGIKENWYLTEDHATKFWGFWAHHINFVYYSQKQLDTYDLLYKIIKDKNYFIITTNADGQFLKGNFDKSKVFAMQGQYNKFQCRHSCHHDLYDNKEMVEKMLEGFDQETLEIRDCDVPRCPHCGELLSPNLRIDQYFVEDQDMSKKEAYLDFVNVHKEKVVFLELGVGFNTPSIIRYPFEEMTYDSQNAMLIRVNNNLFMAPDEIRDKTLITDTDIHELLEGLEAVSIRKDRNVS